MRLGEGTRLGDDATMHSMDNCGDIKDKLSISKFAEFVNRDSLARRIPQEIMFHVEYLITAVTSNTYALLLSQLKRTEAHKSQMEDSIKSAMEDLDKLKDIFFKERELIMKKGCSHE